VTEGSLSSEKLNHRSECGQSEYERDEIALLLPALNPLSIVVYSQISSKLGPAASVEILLQYMSGVGAYLTVSIS